MLSRIFLAVRFYFKLLRLKSYEEGIKKLTRTRQSIVKRQKQLQKQYEDLNEELKVAEGAHKINPNKVIRG